MAGLRFWSATMRSSGVISFVFRRNGWASLFFGSREKISTFAGNQYFRPNVLSVFEYTPYSECMSNSRTLAASLARTPQQISLFRIDLPVPVRPKIANGFSTRFPKRVGTEKHPRHETA